MNVSRLLVLQLDLSHVLVDFVELLFHSALISGTLISIQCHTTCQASRRRPVDFWCSSWTTVLFSDISHASLCHSTSLPPTGGSLYRVFSRNQKNHCPPARPAASGPPSCPPAAIALLGSCGGRCPGSGPVPLHGRRLVPVHVMLINCCSPCQDFF